MSESRIRWHDDPGGNAEGYTGTLSRWAFKIWAPWPGSADEWVLVSQLPGQEAVRRYGADPEALKPEAGDLLAEFAASLGAIFPAGLRKQVQQDRDTYYEQACEHSEMAGHEVQEARASGRVAAYDEVLRMLAGDER